jgi:hypothetical protein
MMMMLELFLTKARQGLHEESATIRVCVGTVDRLVVLIYMLSRTVFLIVSTVLIAFLCGSVRDTASHSCHPRKISFSLWLTTPSLDLIALVIRDGSCAIFNKLVIVVYRTCVLTGKDSDRLFKSTLH